MPTTQESRVSSAAILAIGMLISGKNALEVDIAMDRSRVVNWHFYLYLSGVLNTILNKYQDMQCVGNCQDPDPAQRRYFEQPVWQT